MSGALGLSSRRRHELHDRRCPSRSGWGKALFASNRGERRCEARSSQPLARETSAGVALMDGRVARLGWTKTGGAT